MELNLYLDILKRRIFVIVVVIAAVMSVVAVSGFVIRPVYTSYAMVRVLLDFGVADFTVWEDSGNRMLNTYGQILKSGPFLTEIIERLQLSSMTSDQLWEVVSVEVLPKTELIMISVKHNDPYLARDLENELANLLVEYAQEFYVGSSKSTLQVINEQLVEAEDQLKHNYERLSVLIAKKAPSSEIEALRNRILLEEDTYDRLLDRYELARLSESLRANSVTLIAPAEVPLAPSNALGFMEVGLGFFVGIFGGVALALVLENLDTRIHSAKQLEYLTNVSVLGTVPSGLVTYEVSEKVEKVRTHHSLEEAYRLVNVNLPALKGAISAQSILITSATSRETRSSVAVNLAYTFVDRGQRVFLLDGDLRHPTLFEALGLEEDERRSPGLSDLLTGNLAFSEEVLVELTKDIGISEFFVIGAGAEISRPTSLLASPVMEQLLSYLVTQGYTVLLDAPPVLGVADVSVLGPKLDGILLVVGQALSNREDVLNALKQLQSARAKVLGLVLTSRDYKSRNVKYTLD